MSKICKKIGAIIMVMILVLSMPLVVSADSNGQTEVAIRAFFEAEGAIVEWYSPLRQIIITLDGQTLTLNTTGTAVYQNNVSTFSLTHPIRLEAGTAYMYYYDAQNLLSVINPPVPVIENIPITTIPEEVAAEEEPAEEYADLTDAQRFVEEHAAFNNVLGATGEPHRYLSLPENNTIVYASFDDIMAILDGGTGVFFFGIPTCPSCRAFYPALLQVAIEMNIPLHYFDASYDRAAHNQNYITLLERLHNYLPVDDRNQSPDDPDFDPEMKRVTNPHVFVVVNGEVIAEKMLNRHQLLADEYFEELVASVRELLSYFNTDIEEYDAHEDAEDIEESDEAGDYEDVYTPCPVC